MFGSLCYVIFYTFSSFLSFLSSLESPRLLLICFCQPGSFGTLRIAGWGMGLSRPFQLLVTARINLLLSFIPVHSYYFLMRFETQLPLSVRTHIRDALAWKFHIIKLPFAFSRRLRHAELRMHVD